jgi:hypothetical protein
MGLRIGRRTMRTALCGLGLAVGLAATPALGAPAAGASGGSGVVVGQSWDARPAVAFAVSRPLRALAGPSAPPHWFPLGTSKRDMIREALLQGTPPGGVADTVVQRERGELGIPAPSVSFEGIPQVTSGGRPIPPDPVGEIGPRHFVQMVNVRYAVYDRSGHAIVPPVETSVLFEPLGDICGVTNEGDPIVAYDQFADRWILTQFGFLSSAVGAPKGPFYQCVAISQTGDPAGSYFLYAFEISKTALNDYPKLGVWPDGYYLSSNSFVFRDDGSGFFAGATVAVLERERLLAGDPDARLLVVDLPFTDVVRFSLLPSDADGPVPPPAGRPNTFAQLGLDVFRGHLPELQLFQFRTQWGVTPRAVFSGPAIVPVEPYDANLCNFAPCVPQRGTFQRLDTLSERLMFRLAYRNFETHESLVVNHAVDVGGDRAGIRWYEIRNPLNPAIHQQGTYAPGLEHRWMGSIAMDGNGNIGLGYSVSGPDLFPSIRYAGQVGGSELGELNAGEAAIVAAGGAQTHPAGRWGDYADLTVDPLDDCTFWFTSEYLSETSERGWRTRVAAFKVDEGCDATAPTARARQATIRAGATGRLRYTTSDNSGETTETVTVYRANGRRVRTLAAPLGPDGAGSVSLRAPTQAGAYRWCVVATDAKENASADACARLTVRPR